MPDQTPEFSLGIIGGCLSHQRNTPVSQLYHRQLAALLKVDPGVRLRPRIARDFGLDYVSRLDRLLAGARLDGVLVHIREATLAAAARAFVVEITDGKSRRRLNPAMLHRGHHGVVEGRSSGHELLTNAIARGADAYSDGDDLQDLPLPGRRIAGFRFRNLNYLLGVAAGMGRWAIDDELIRFDKLVRACRQQDVPLFALGPTPATYSMGASVVTRQANARIRRLASVVDVPCALMEQTRDYAGRPITRGDGFHMTASGHRFIADQLYEQGMREWVARIIAAREQASDEPSRGNAGTQVRATPAASASW